MTSALNKTADNTIELTITIPWAEIAKTYDSAVEEMVKKAEVPGFRPGKAPRKKVEESLDKNKVYEEVIKQVLPKAYAQAVNENQLKPIVYPQIELKEAVEGKDWAVIARTAEKPEIKLGDYKKAISEVKTAQRPKIYVPGQAEKADEKESKLSLDDILNALLTKVEVTVPAILIEHEVTHRLSELIDEVRKLGLTVEQYLSSTKRTAESLRAEYAEQARRMLILELALTAIAESEKITVEDSEIDKIVASAKTEEEKKSLINQKYYLATIVRRQKTLDFLSRL